MDIYFNSKKLAKACNEARECNKAFGPEIAKKVQQRLFELKAAETLADVSHLPPTRCHELGGDRKGEFAVDLKHPFRLVFILEDPVPRTADGGIDRSQVTAIIILEVEDYHGR